MSTAQNHNDHQDLPEVLDSETVLEHWCSLPVGENGHRDLPEQMVDFLDRGFETSISGLVASFPTAPGTACTECDLPQGSTWAEVEAVMLDTVLNPGKDAHLLEVQEFTPALEVA